MAFYYREISPGGLVNGGATGELMGSGLSKHMRLILWRETAVRLNVKIKITQTTATSFQVTS